MSDAEIIQKARVMASNAGSKKDDLRQMLYAVVTLAERQQKDANRARRIIDVIEEIAEETKTTRLTIGDTRTTEV